MLEQIQGILMILSIPAILIGGIAFGIYCLNKSCELEAKEDQKYRDEAEKTRKEEEATAPQYQIRFVDSGREEHVTKIYRSRVSTNYYTRKIEKRFYITSSREVAENALEVAYKYGYIEDAEGNTFPTCNLHKLSIEEAK